MKLEKIKELFKKKKRDPFHKKKRKRKQSKLAGQVASDGAMEGTAVVGRQQG